MSYWKSHSQGGRTRIQIYYIILEKEGGMECMFDESYLTSSILLFGFLLLPSSPCICISHTGLFLSSFVKWWKYKVMQTAPQPSRKPILTFNNLILGRAMLKWVTANFWRPAPVNKILFIVNSPEKRGSGVEINRTWASQMVGRGTWKIATWNVICIGKEIVMAEREVMCETSVFLTLSPFCPQREVGREHSVLTMNTSWSAWPGELSVVVLRRVRERDIKKTWVGVQPVRGSGFQFIRARSPSCVSPAGAQPRRAWP